MLDHRTICLMLWVQSREACALCQALIGCMFLVPSSLSNELRQFPQGKITFKGPKGRATFMEILCALAEQSTQEGVPYSQWFTISKMAGFSCNGPIE